MGEEAATRRLYRRAQRAEELPWHRGAPHPWVVRAARGATPLRVLDIGCGAGLEAVALARQGHHVTAVDREPTATRWARERAASAGVQMRIEEADILSLEFTDPFDLVLDLGCLHSVRGEARGRYFGRLKQWVAPRGQYILMHFIKRGVLSLGLRGPLRAHPHQLHAALSPWMKVEETKTEQHRGRPGLGSVASLTLRARRR